MPSCFFGIKSNVYLTENISGNITYLNVDKMVTSGKYIDAFKTRRRVVDARYIPLLKKGLMSIVRFTF